MKRLIRKVLWLRAEGLTFREIEEELNIGTGNGTVAMRIARRWGLS